MLEKSVKSDRNAKDSSDYDEVTGELTFDADNPTQIISVPINGDTLAESSEFFNVSIRRSTDGAVITDGLALGIIQNDDSLPAGIESDRFTAFVTDTGLNDPSDSEVADIL